DPGPPPLMAPPSRTADRQAHLLPLLPRPPPTRPPCAGAPWAGQVPPREGRVGAHRPPSPRPAYRIAREKSTSPVFRSTGRSLAALYAATSGHFQPPPTGRVRCSGSSARRRPDRPHLSAPSHR